MSHHLTRRAVLAGAPAVPLAAAVPAVARDDDRALVAAERQIARLWASVIGLPDDEAHPIIKHILDLELFIAHTPAVSLAGAAVKLRRLADPDAGLEAGMSDRDLPLLRSALAAIEREIGGRALR